MPYPYTNGDVLNGSDLNAVGLHLVTPSSVTGGTLSGATVNIGSAVSSVTVNGVFSADFDHYRIIVAGSQGSAISAMELTLGSKTTGYFGIRRITQFTTGADINYTKNNASEWEVGSFQSANDGTFCAIELAYPFSSTITACYWSEGWGGGYMNRATGDESTAAASHTSFTIACNSGTFSGGTIRVYGYSNGG